MSPQQSRMMMRSGESISFNFILLERFAWSCEITFSQFPYVLQPQPFCFISHDYAKSKIMLFRLLFSISLISSCLIHLHHLQLSSKAWSKCISSSSSSTLCTLFHSIFHLSLHASKITLKYLQNSTKNHQYLLQGQQCITWAYQA